MDPYPEKPADTRPRFPRARGDGPSALSRRRLSTPLPPRSRGWTRPRRLLHADEAASPALAGMDPSAPATSRRRSGFPRARGDGPGAPDRLALLPGLPPRSRGWTRMATHGRGRAQASPALAGMDRWKRCISELLTGFPRARGDGPLLIRSPMDWPPLPPRSRGWTLVTLLGVFQLQASPALAGMDPGDASSVCLACCFPRARGDGPLVVPREVDPSKLPPRSRGWTLHDGPHLGRLRASPALAGMDP
mgnify:CR=1 FL=1